MKAPMLKDDYLKSRIEIHHRELELRELIMINFIDNLHKGITNGYTNTYEMKQTTNRFHSLRNYLVEWNNRLTHFITNDSSITSLKSHL